MSTCDPANLAARNLIAARLIEHQALDPLDAHTAVTRVAIGMPTEHEDLVRQEASAALDEMTAVLREHFIRMFAAVAPAIQAFGEAIARAVEQLPQPPSRVPQSRPAWQSPYGPPQKGHRS